jgi:hypothetical protein
VGVALGLGAAWGLGRVVEHQLFGLSAADPVAIGVAVAVMSVPRRWRDSCRRGARREWTRWRRRGASSDRGVSWARPPSGWSNAARDSVNVI